MCGTRAAAAGFGRVSTHGGSPLDCVQITGEYASSVGIGSAGVELCERDAGEAQTSLNQCVTWTAGVDPVRQ